MVTFSPHNFQLFFFAFKVQLSTHSTLFIIHQNSFDGFFLFMLRENFKTYCGQILLPLFGMALLVGVICGLILGLYDWVAGLGTTYALKLYNYCHQHMHFYPIPFFSVIALGLINGALIYKFQEIRGSEIPYIEAVSLGKIEVTWYSSLPIMFLASIISLSTGLSLGREGPSVYMGGCIGYAISQIIPFAKVHKCLLVAAGASTGAAIAFHAPVAGLLFSVEEIYRKFSSVISMTSGLTVCVGYFMKILVFKLDKLDFGFIPYSFKPVMFLISFVCGVICGLVGVAFNLFLRLMRKLYKKMNPPVPLWLNPVIPCIIAAVIGVTIPEAAFEGQYAMEKLFLHDLPLWKIITAFFIKFIFTGICFGSLASGGIFIPTLAVGAYLGSCLAKLYIAIGMDPYYENYVILVSISAFFTGVVRAPLTGTIIFPEFSGEYTGFFGPLTSSAFAYFISEATRVPPIYETLVNDLILAFQNQHPQAQTTELDEFVFIVDGKSMVRGLDLNELTLPGGIAISRVIRKGVPLVPTDDLVLEADDEVWFISEDQNTLQAEARLKVIF